jgi:site-specific DNA-methyltransferase (adenine-specific)
MSVTLYLRHGDCVQVLGEYPEGSVGAVVCDPPYELSFMGKGWDGTGVAYDPVLWNHLYRVLVPGGTVKDKRSKGGGLKFEGAALATNRTGDGASGLSKDFTPFVPATDAAQRWEGWGTALKPSWEPVLVGRKPLS